MIINNVIVSITAISNVTMPGYLFDLETFNGAITQKGPIQQSFNFSTLPATPADTVKANVRTVYTGTPGDIPTVIKIGSMTVNSKTINDFYATFAKSLKSGYSYTMTMRIGNVLEPGRASTLTDNLPAGYLRYVGAFWKNSQKGERLIRMPRASTTNTYLIDSVWTAQVIDGKDWILLDTMMTTDTNISWISGSTSTESSIINGNDPTFETDAARQLTKPTASNFVSGYLNASKNQIYFRIGLTGTQPAGTPPRYGLVLLTFGNNKYRHRIWIRQGEEPDYLMRPRDTNMTGDVVPSGATSSRPNAKKFSPYNLTDPGKNTETTYANAPNLGTGGGRFVDYPSKAGYHFQWGGNTKAFHPTNAISGWSPGGSGNTWNVAWETCPTGYRRPTDITTTGTNNSEYRQSLWITGVGAANPSNENYDNVIYGYYADGYFDRRQIVQGVTATPALLTAVASPGAEVAYRGMLFYNQFNNASLFFPVTGFRNNTTGALDQAGKSGHYWSLSYLAATNPMQLAFDTDAPMSHMASYIPNYGISIRCISDACAQLDSLKPVIVRNDLPMMGGVRIHLATDAGRQFVIQFAMPPGMPTGVINGYDYTNAVIEGYVAGYVFDNDYVTVAGVQYPVFTTVISPDGKTITVTVNSVPTPIDNSYGVGGAFYPYIKVTGPGGATCTGQKTTLSYGYNISD